MYRGLLKPGIPSHGALALKLFAIAALCALAYAPSLALPLIEDDYPNLAQAQTFGPPGAASALMQDPTFRLRATSYWTMWSLWQTVHLTPWAYHLTSLTIHIANAFLIYGMAAAWPGMRRAAFWAAAFFAVHEGHQEAVMWFSAINELFLFLFGAASLLCWMRAGEAASRGWRIALDACSAILFALALMSKESAVLLPAFFALVAATAGRNRWSGPPGLLIPGTTFWRLIPHLMLAALAAASILESRGASFRFSDGSFSLAAPFWITWPRGMARLLWPWGWLAALIVWRSDKKSAFSAAAWMGLGLVPYIFLTYSTEIPSRQTYLASAGLALLVGAAMASAAATKRTRTVAAVAAVILLVNVGYLWTRKRTQFLERAAPTEQLIRLARQTPGPIWVQCFPRTPYIAQEAVHMGAGRDPSVLIWSDAAAAADPPSATFCFTER